MHVELRRLQPLAKLGHDAVGHVGVQVEEQRGVGRVAARRDLGRVVLVGRDPHDVRQGRQRRQHAGCLRRECLVRDQPFVVVKGNLDWRADGAEVLLVALERFLGLDAVRGKTTRAQNRADLRQRQ